MSEITAARLVDEPTQHEVEMFGFTTDESVKPLRFGQLRNSIRVEGKFGKQLPTRPVQSWELMSYIISMMEQNSYNFTQDVIYVQKKNSHIMINEDEKKKGFTKELCPINRWLFDKILTKWTIPFIGDSLDRAAIAMGFNENGIELAFGMHIHVCSNFNILGGNIIRTYAFNGQPAASFELIQLKLQDWFRNLKQMIRVETAIMNAMKDHRIGSPDIVQNVIGKLYVKAIEQAYGNKAYAPFTTHALSNMVQNYISKKDPVIIENAWDLYNWGTQIMKPGIVDLAEINNASDSFCKFVLEDLMHVDRDGFAIAEVVE